MAIDYGTLYKSVQIGRNGARDVDIDNEIRKILKKELSNSIKEIMTSSTNFGKDESFMPVEKRRQDGGGCMPDLSGMDIDQIIAQVLIQGVQTSGVLRNLFGIVPSLIGR